MNIVENHSPSKVNFNDHHTLRQHEGLVTEYDEQTEVQCHCGKLCKCDLGLRAHQRYCQISDVPELREFFNKNLSKNS